MVGIGQELRRHLLIDRPQFSAETGNGPKGRRVILSAQGDYVTVISDGAGWHTVGASTPTVGATYIEGTAGLWGDIARPLCMVSGGRAGHRLPRPVRPRVGAGRSRSKR